MYINKDTFCPVTHFWIHISWNWVFSFCSPPQTRYYLWVVTVSLAAGRATVCVCVWEGRKLGSKPAVWCFDECVREVSVCFTLTGSRADPTWLTGYELSTYQELLSHGPEVMSMFYRVTIWFSISISPSSLPTVLKNTRFHTNAGNILLNRTLAFSPFLWRTAGSFCRLGWGERLDPLWILLPPPTLWLCARVCSCSRQAEDSGECVTSQLPWISRSPPSSGCLHAPVNVMMHSFQFCSTVHTQFVF